MTLRPHCRLQFFAQIARRQERIVPVFAIHQEDVYDARKLAMLKAVVEDVSTRYEASRGIMLP